MLFLTSVSLMDKECIRIKFAITESRLVRSVRCNTLIVLQANLCSHETAPSWHGGKFVGCAVTERHITKRGKVPGKEKFTKDSGGSSVKCQPEEVLS